MPAPSSAEREARNRSGAFLHARPDQRVAALAAESWGVVSTAELLGCGLSKREISGRVSRGQFHPMHRGAYAVGHPNPPWQGRVLAAGKACGPDAVISHLSAAALWGLLDYDADRFPEVTIAGGNGERHPGIRIHRTGVLPARDRARAQQVPVTAVPRTLLDLAGSLDRRSLRSVVRRAQGRGGVNVCQLAEVLARLGPRRGSRRLALLVATGPAPTRSVLEDIVLELLLTGGLEHPDVNKPLLIDGRRVISDFRWPSQRLVLEADGAAWHDTELARAADAERQALLEESGERVLRVSWTQALTRRSQTLARLGAAGAPCEPASTPPGEREVGTRTGA